MKTFHWLMIALLAVSVVMVGCKKDETVPSGTYKGKVSKVNADEKEIYVTTEDDVMLELYFTDETKLTRDGQPVDFAVLEEEQVVHVEVENRDGQMVPIAVKIVDASLIEETPLNEAEETVDEAQAELDEVGEQIQDATTQAAETVQKQAEEVISDPESAEDTAEKAAAEKAVTDAAKDAASGNGESADSSSSDDMMKKATDAAKDAAEDATK